MLDNRLAWTMLVAAAFFSYMAMKTAARGEESSWLDKAKDYNCDWVNKQLERYTPEQLERKARRWHVPDEYINLAKACPRNLKPSIKQ